MRISEVTMKDFTDYLRLDDPSEIEESEIERMKASAVSYMIEYTGLTVDEMDQFEDMTQALFILVADMFDNRNPYIEGKASNVNKSVQTILGLHSVNLL